MNLAYTHWAEGHGWSDGSVFCSARLRGRLLRQTIIHMHNLQCCLEEPAFICQDNQNVFPSKIILYLGHKTARDRDSERKREGEREKGREKKRESSGLGGFVLGRDGSCEGNPECFPSRRPQRPSEWTLQLQFPPCLFSCKHVAVDLVRYSRCGCTDHNHPNTKCLFQGEECARCFACTSDAYFSTVSKNARITDMLTNTSTHTHRYTHTHIPQMTSFWLGSDWNC